MTFDSKTLNAEERALWDAMAIQERRNRRVASESYSETEGAFRDLLKARRALFGEPASEGKVECPKSAAIEREAREAAEQALDKKRSLLKWTDNAYLYGDGYGDGFLAAATLREKEIEESRAKLVQQAHDYRAQVVFWGENADQRTAEIAAVRARVAAVSAQLTEAKSAIRWMHGYDEPGTEAFPICPEGKRYAWRGVSWQQFSIVREACAEQIPVPEANNNASQQGV